LIIFVFLFLAIEFESHRCDLVHDSKFPRTRTDKTPWKFYRDSAYYRVNCKLPKSKLSRKRRNTVDAVMEARTKHMREKRAIQINTSKILFNDECLKIY